jgi:alpha-tubulin suppressor-like RCC1 family protein
LKEVENPKRVEFFVKNKKKAIKVVCGGYHTMVLCDDNHLFGFGKGTYGQLGYGGSEDSNVPKLVKFSKVFAHFEKVKIKFYFIL